MEMQALVEEIAALVQKLNNGTATLGELEAFAAATQQLNERAIILRYKAYEAKVFGTSTPLSDLRSSFEEQTSAPIETDQNKPLSEISIDNSNISEETAIQIEAESSVEETEDLSFDLFSIDEEPEVTIEEETPIEKVNETAPIEETPVFVAKEAVIEQTAVEQAIFGSPVIEEPEASQPIIVDETPIQPEPAPIVFASTENDHPIIRKARTNDGSMQSRLLSVRLETLKSAFGLNERMLIVRELFNGSNDAYSEAIEALDSQTEVNSARSKVTAYANQYGWKEDNELAVEFVQKVERRYV